MFFIYLLFLYCPIAYKINCILVLNIGYRYLYCPWKTPNISVTQHFLIHLQKPLCICACCPQIKAHLAYSWARTDNVMPKVYQFTPGDLLHLSDGTCLTVIYVTISWHIDRRNINQHKPSHTWVSCFLRVWMLENVPLVSLPLYFYFCGKRKGRPQQQPSCCGVTFCLALMHTEKLAQQYNASPNALVQALSYCCV